VCWSGEGAHLAPDLGKHPPLVVGVARIECADPALDVQQLLLVQLSLSEQGTHH
jgi:hypothetical protein